MRAAKRYSVLAVVLLVCVMTFASLSERAQARPSVGVMLDPQQTVDAYNTGTAAAVQTLNAAAVQTSNAHETETASYATIETGLTQTAQAHQTETAAATSTTTPTPFPTCVATITFPTADVVARKLSTAWITHATAVSTEVCGVGYAVANHNGIIDPRVTCVWVAVYNGTVKPPPLQTSIPGEVTGTPDDFASSSLLVGLDAANGNPLFLRVESTPSATYSWPTYTPMATVTWTLPTRAPYYFSSSLAAGLVATPPYPFQIAPPGAPGGPLAQTPMPWDLPVCGLNWARNQMFDHLYASRVEEMVGSDHLTATAYWAGYATPAVTVPPFVTPTPSWPALVLVPDSGAVKKFVGGWIAGESWADTGGGLYFNSLGKRNTLYPYLYSPQAGTVRTILEVYQEGQTGTDDLDQVCHVNRGVGYVWNQARLDLGIVGESYSSGFNNLSSVMVNEGMQVGAGQRVAAFNQWIDIPETSGEEGEWDIRRLDVSWEVANNFLDEDLAQREETLNGDDSWALLSRWQGYWPSDSVLYRCCGFNAFWDPFGWKPAHSDPWEDLTGIASEDMVDESQTFACASGCSDGSLTETIDDLDPGFRWIKTGYAINGRTVDARDDLRAPVGYKMHAWTLLPNGIKDEWVARWQSKLPPGMYEAEAYIPCTNDAFLPTNYPETVPQESWPGTWKVAKSFASRYVVDYGSGRQSVLVNQNAYCNVWHPLGIYRFTKPPAVELGSNMHIYGRTFGMRQMDDPDQSPAEEADCLAHVVDAVRFRCVDTDEYGNRYKPTPRPWVTATATPSKE